MARWIRIAFPGSPDSALTPSHPRRSSTLHSSSIGCIVKGNLGSSFATTRNYQRLSRSRHQPFSPPAVCSAAHRLLVWRLAPAQRHCAWNLFCDRSNRGRSGGLRGSTDHWCVVVSSEYFDSVGNHFHALMLAFLGAMCGFCLTGDLFKLVCFFELMSAAAFALCGYKTDDPGSVQGALNFAVVNTIAAYFVLTGIGLIYARTQALNMAQIGRTLALGPIDNLVLVGFVFLVCGYLVKAAVVPFHFWLADAHAVAPTPVCLLFSGVMVELGLFALARIYWASFHQALHAHLSALTTLFVTTGIVTAFVGAFMCYLQHNVKRLLAFSTISHVGLMLIGIGLFAPEGLAGTAIYVLGHGMVKGGLFLVAGILLHRFQVIDVRDLHGKARREKWTAVVFFAGALGLAALPFSGLAMGHDLVSAAAESAGYGWTKWIFVFAGAVTAAAVLRACGHIFFGWGPVEERDTQPKQEEKPETHAGHDRTPATMFVPAAVFVTAGLLLGFAPSLKTVTVEAAQSFREQFCLRGSCPRWHSDGTLRFQEFRADGPAGQFTQCLWRACHRGSRSGERSYTRNV